MLHTPSSHPVFLSRLYVHPVKGLTPHRVQEALLRAHGGLENDRLYAFAYADAVEGEAQRQNAEPGALSELTALPKPQLLQQNDWPALARLSLAFDAASGSLEIHDPLATRGNDHVRADPQTAAGRLALETFMNAFLAKETRGSGALSRGDARVRLVGGRSNATRFPDRASVDVTFVSARTLADLEARFGAAVDERRFRINLILEGLEAWSEETLVGRSLAVGDARLRVKGPVRRCFNVNVNPERGERDLALLEWLKPHLGHAVVGYTAMVEVPGTVRAGDAVFFSTEG